MSCSGLRWLRFRTAVAVVLLALAASCGGDDSTSDTGEWLRIAGNSDESPEEIACVEAAMEDLLSEDELEQWLSLDPETITVEQIQSLPHAIEIANRCR